MKANTKKIAVLGLLTAIVVLLQTALQIHAGVFTISTVLVPIVIGAALYGPWAGAWLGLVFGATVLLSGQAAYFMGFNPAGTIITVMVKGILCGLGSGLIYKVLVKNNPKTAAIVASVAAPCINTGVFIIGCLIFFRQLGDFKYIITAFVGFNFIIELIVNILLSSVVIFLIRYAKRRA